MNILAIGSIAGAFNDIPLGTKLLFLAIIIAIIAANKGGKSSGGGRSSGGGSSFGGPSDGATSV